MPFVKRAILDKLLRDDEEWKKLLVEGQAEVAKQVGDQYRAQIEDQEKVIASLLDDNARLGNSRDERLRLSALDLATRHGQDVMGDARRFEAFLRDGGQEDRAEGVPDEGTAKLGLGDLRGSGQSISEPGGTLFNAED